MNYTKENALKLVDMIENKFGSISRFNGLRGRALDTLYANKIRPMTKRVFLDVYCDYIKLNLPEITEEFIFSVQLFIRRHATTTRGFCWMYDISESWMYQFLNYRFKKITPNVIKLIKLMDELNQTNTIGIEGRMPEKK